MLQTHPRALQLHLMHIDLLMKECFIVAQMFDNKLFYYPTLLSVQRFKEKYNTRNIFRGNHPSKEMVNININSVLFSRTVISST